MFAIVIEEIVPAGCVGLSTVVNATNPAQGRLWLMNNGFNHRTTASPDTDDWIREGPSAGTFKTGLSGTGPKSEVRADHVLKAKIVPVLEATEVLFDSLKY